VDEIVLSLYAKGLTTGEISAHFAERDVFFMVCDGLNGLPDVVEHVWPQAAVQTCIIHPIRNPFRLASRAGHDAIKRDLKAIYTAPTADRRIVRPGRARREIGQEVSAIIRLWRNAYTVFVPFLDYDVEIRRVISSTNAIESLTPVTGGRCGAVIDAFAITFSGRRPGASPTDRRCRKHPVRATDPRREQVILLCSVWSVGPPLWWAGGPDAGVPLAPRPWRAR
jgi:transposase-like protein